MSELTSRTQTFAQSARSRAAQTIRDSLNRRTNRVDTFTVNLSKRSSFNANLSGIKRKNNVDLELLNSSGTVIAASRNPGRRSEQIVLGDLAAGTYTLRTTLKRGKQTAYRLVHDSTPLTPADFAGNTPGTARSLGSLSASPMTMSDYVGSEDSNDFYGFTVGEPGSPSAKLSLKLTGAAGGLLRNGDRFGNISVKLRNSLNEVIETESSVFDGNAIEFTQTLAAGNYFVEIVPYFRDGGGDYDLTLSAAATADSAGNTPATARTVGLSSIPASFQDFVGAGDPSDFYKFTLGSPRTLNLTLTGVGGNLLEDGIQVKLRDSLNNVIRTENSVFDGASISLTRSLTAGTYFVEVSPYFDSDNTPYVLSLSA